MENEDQVKLGGGFIGFGSMVHLWSVACADCRLQCAKPQHAVTDTGTREQERFTV